MCTQCCGHSVKGHGEGLLAVLFAKATTQQPITSIFRSLGKYAPLFRSPDLRSRLSLCHFNLCCKLNSGCSRLKDDFKHALLFEYLNYAFSAEGIGSMNVFARKRCLHCQNKAYFSIALSVRCFVDERWWYKHH